MVKDNHAGLWLTRPVFITSTFRDMHAERDHLRSHVLPELEERLRERRCHLEPIDLRWGVETVSETESEAKELRVLKVCLGEVERSRPFIIGILGDRYGWVPPPDRMSAAAKEAGLSLPVTGKSITDLEIDFGVMSDPEQRSRCFFYFRKPLPYEEMSKEDAARYSDGHHPDVAIRASAAKLEALKAKLEARYPGRVRRYAANWDRERRVVTGLEAFGTQVIEDLWGELVKETAAQLDTEASAFKTAQWSLEQFIEDRTRDFVGRTALLDDLVRHACSSESDEVWGVCLTAQPGAGKSAIFAALERRLEEEDVLILAHATGAGPDSSQVDQLLSRWTSELASHLGIDVIIEPGGKVLEAQFLEFLGAASRNRRVVLLIDALDQFEPTPRARYLTWLPKLWPSNARLVATAISGTASNALKERSGATLLELEPLTPSESANVVDTICARYHRKLPGAVAASLLEKRGADSTRAAGNPLWLELAVEELNLLDADDFERAELEFSGSADERLVELMLSIVNVMPPTVANLYTYLLSRAEKVFGEPLVRSFGSLLALGRFGWRELDFAALLQEAGTASWDALQFASLRRAFRAHVVQRGPFGQWCFAHAQMTEAVLARYLASVATRRTLHRRIADHLEGLSSGDPLRAGELMFHLLGEGDSTRIVRHYADYFPAGQSTVGESGATPALVERTVSDEAEGIAVPYVVALLQGAELDEENLHNLCARVIADLAPALANDAQLTTQLAVLTAARDRLAPLVEANFTRDSAFRNVPIENLASCDDAIGDIYYHLGDLSAARAVFERGIAAREIMATQEPSLKETWQGYLASSYQRLAWVQRLQGDLTAALQSHQANLAILRHAAELLPDSADCQGELAGSLGDFSVAQLEAGDLQGARQSTDESIAILERLAASPTDAEQWQSKLLVTRAQSGDVAEALGDLQACRSIREAILEAALNWAASDPGSTARQEIVLMAYERLGSACVALGDTDAARAAGELAIECAKRLAAHQRENAWYQRNLANCYLHKGEYDLSQGDLASARAAYEASLEIFTRLLTLDSDNVEWQRDLAINYQRLAELTLTEGNVDRAISLESDGRDTLRRLTEIDAGNPRWKMALAKSHVAVGDLLETRKDAAAARREYDAGHEIAERISKSPFPDRNAITLLALCDLKIGNILKAGGELEEAHARYYHAAEILEVIDDNWPNAFEARAIKAAAYEGLGEVLLNNYQSVEAQGMFENALRIAYELATEQPLNLERRRTVWHTSLRAGDALILQSDLAEAQKRYQLAREVLAKMQELDSESVETFRAAALTHTKFGTLYRLSGHLQHALHEYTQARMCRSALAAVDRGLEARKVEVDALCALKSCADAIAADEPEALVLVDTIRSQCIDAIVSMRNDGLPIDDSLNEIFATLSKEQSSSVGE